MIEEEWWEEEYEEYPEDEDIEDLWDLIEGDEYE